MSTTQYTIQSKKILQPFLDRWSSTLSYKRAYTPFHKQQQDVLEKQPQKQTFGGPVAEDRRMTLQAFNTLIQQMVLIQGDLCPLSGKMFNPFNNQIMPDLSCPGLKINFGGRRTRKSTKLKYKKHKSKKNKSRIR